MLYGGHSLRPRRAKPIFSRMGQPAVLRPLTARARLPLTNVAVAFRSIFAWRWTPQR